MPVTHCLPNTSLGTGELSVPTVSAANMTIQDPGVGNRRGYVVFMHGLNVAQVTNFPLPIPNSGTSGFYSRIGDFANAVVADGWVFIYPAYQEDFYTGKFPNTQGDWGVYNDVTNDSQHGVRYVNSTLHWFDHLVACLAKTYGAGHPLVISGASWGATRTLHIAGNRKSSILGYICHYPATLIETCDNIFTSGIQFSTANWSGMDFAANYLSSMNVTCPGIFGYGTADEAVGYDGTTTVDVGSNNVDVSTFTGSQTLHLVDTSTIVVGPSIKLQTSNGFAYVSFNAKGAGVLNNCTTIIGTGTLQTGYTVIQSASASMVTSAVGASLPLSTNITSQPHEFTGTPSGVTNDAATYAAWVASTMDPLAPAHAF